MKGDTGAQGPVGAQGIPGPVGDEGPKGDTGPQVNICSVLIPKNSQYCLFLGQPRASRTKSEISLSSII